jgi:hypothetical protein
MSFVMEGRAVLINGGGGCLQSECTSGPLVMRQPDKLSLGNPILGSGAAPCALAGRYQRFGET